MPDDIAQRMKERAERELLALHGYSYTYRFGSEVSDSSVATCLAKLVDWRAREPHASQTEAEIEIVFSNGLSGSLDAAMRLYDYIGEFSASTRAAGHMSPLAVILLQAGTVRVIDSDAWGLVQNPSLWDSSATLASTIKVFDIFTRRGGNLLAASQIRRNWHRPDWWLDAAQLLALGLADQAH